MEAYTEWSEDMAEALQEPFAAASHSEKTQGGSKITYVDVHEYKERLNATVGPHGWSSAVRMEAYGGNLIVVVALTVLGVTKENVGDEVEEAPLNERGNSKLIGSSCTNAYAQAFKRACSDFGLGAYLYDKERREAAVRGANPPARSQAPRSGSATEKQMNYLDSLMKSSVFADDERARVAGKVAARDAKVVSQAIEWAKEQVTVRKQPAGVA